MIWRGMQRVAAENPQMDILLDWSAAQLTKCGNDRAAFINDIRIHGFTPYHVKTDGNGQLALSPAPDIAAIKEGHLLLSRGFL